MKLQICDCIASNLSSTSSKEVIIYCYPAAAKCSTFHRNIKDLKLNEETVISAMLPRLKFLDCVEDSNLSPHLTVLRL